MSFFRVSFHSFRQKRDSPSECLRSLSDLAVSAPEILATTLAAAKEGDVDRQTLMAALLKECKKEKLEYRVVALEATGTILSELKWDHFQVNPEIQ